MSNRTIIAPASATLRSGVIVIRVSGPNSEGLLKFLTKQKMPQPRLASVRKIYNKNNEVIDESLVVLFKAPNSFTGEDVVEFHIHGGMAILTSFMSEALNSGLVVMANAGEFTRQAFENGRMDLSEAEGLIDLIDAETENQRKQAMRQMQGELGSLAKEWRNEIVGALSEAEAYIDFPDEDLPSGLSASSRQKIISLIDSLKNHLNSSQNAQRVRDGFKIAIIGAPNAGKSSLLNKIAKRDAAIVSSIAGTTRDIVEISMNLGGQLVFIADTAGIRETEDEIEGEGVKRAIIHAEDADLRIALATDETSLSELLPILKTGDLVVWSKSDVLGLRNAQHIDFEQINISNKNNENIEELENLIISKVNAGIASIIDAPLTRQRHKIAVSDAIISLENALNAPDEAPELACEDLRMAARALGEITGIVAVDDILDRIFSSFCIGK